ncbi:hypothetical protein ASC77_13675 [Nocardioides sp. Root1257]|uniref:TolB family protein n=1 Tax=unclassified Nocardioides TaxID=2615069 RepID=UPI0006F95D03|nr:MULTISPECIES: hypothetical protein [unclassified Nocardioides]KQW47500.1 hypothetical protein ASC77_13675 [Nocardioides sp. Root1257]KRC45656.1 hypothetical protein ASE24_13680 [Nocardioides sp. Root224]
MRTLARLVLLVALLAFGLPAVAASAQAPAPTARSGHLLIEGGVFKVPGGSRPLSFRSWCQPTVFSPDGSMLASGKLLRNGCRASTLVIRRAHGPTTELPHLQGGVATSISWSPDQTRLAVYLANNTGDEIWIANVDGSGATKAYDGGTGALRLDSDTVSWSPDGTRLAVSGTDKVHLADLKRGGRSYVGQIYTIPVPGGAPQPYNVPDVDPSCATSVACRSVRYAAALWSPDGTHLLADATDVTWRATGGIDASTAAATVAEAGTAPERLRTLRQVSYPASARPNIGTPSFAHWWSADGRTVISATVPPAGAPDLPGLEPYAYIDVATHRAKRVGPPRSVVYDWQPCPTGTCVVWPAGRKPSVAITAVHPATGKHDPLRIVGAVSPRQPSDRVRLWLDVRRGGEWRPFAYTYARPSSRGRMLGYFYERPKSGRCRVVATYLLQSAVRPVKC